MWWRPTARWLRANCGAQSTRWGTGANAPSCNGWTFWHFERDGTPNRWTCCGRQLSNEHALLTVRGWSRPPRDWRSLENVRMTAFRG